MTTDQLTVGTAFNRCFETLDASEDVFAPDAFFDLLPPFWRFQLRGPDAFAAQLRSLARGRSVGVRLLRVVPTATGFVPVAVALSSDRPRIHRRVTLPGRSVRRC